MRTSMVLLFCNGGFYGALHPFRFFIEMDGSREAFPEIRITDEGHCNE